MSTTFVLKSSDWQSCYRKVRSGTYQHRLLWLTPAGTSFRQALRSYSAAHARAQPKTPFQLSISYICAGRLPRRKPYP